MIQHLHLIKDLELQQLINMGKIDLVVPMPLKTLRWLHDPESKVLLISESLCDQSKAMV